MSSIEMQTGIEKNEVPKTTFLDDFRLPEGVGVPKGILDRYMGLSEAARDTELHSQIEASLHDLELRIQKRNQDTSLTLATVFHG